MSLRKTALIMFIISVVMIAAGYRLDAGGGIALSIAGALMVGATGCVVLHVILLVIPLPVKTTNARVLEKHLFNIYDGYGTGKFVTFQFPDNKARKLEVLRMDYLSINIGDIVESCK